MPKKKSLVHLGIPVALLLGVKLIAPFPSQGQSISQTNQSTSVSHPVSLREGLEIEFKSPPGNGEPKESDIAGTRGNCLPKDSDGLNVQDNDQSILPLTPVLPATSDRRFYYPGLTISEHPTLFIFVPQTSATTAQFSLSDENGNQELYEATFPLTNTPGIISIQIPEFPEKSLEVGHRYSWGFSLVCPSDSSISDSSGNPTIFGIIERTEISANLVSAIDSDDSLNNALLYAQMGLWHDTLMTLVRLRKLQPDNLILAAIWQDLLKADSVNLNDIAEQPLIDCCQEGEINQD